MRAVWKTKEMIILKQMNAYFQNASVRYSVFFSWHENMTCSIWNVVTWHSVIFHL